MASFLNKPRPEVNTFSEHLFHVFGNEKGVYVMLLWDAWVSSQVQFAEK